MSSSSPDLTALSAPFAEEELRTFAGRGGKEFTYIEDETVMDRLDQVFGMGNWQIHVEPVPAYEGVVRVTLLVRVNPEMDWISHQDFGYPSNAGGEALKEAVSDGIRRCGRYLGIARDLYRKDSPPVVRTNGGQVTTTTVTNTPTPLRPRSSTALPPEPNLDWDVLSTKKPEPFGTAAIAARSGDGSMTTRELLERSEALKVPTKVLAEASKRLFGPNAWKLTDLTDVQRYAVAIEVGLV